MPSGTDPGHPDAVPVNLQNASGKVVGTDVVPAGTAVRVRPARGHPDRVAIRWRGGLTAVGPRAAFWVMPSFIQLKDVTVTVDGRRVPLAESGLRYHRGSVATFEEPLHAPLHGTIATNQGFLACRRDTWGMGGQTFAVDLVEDGVLRHDRAMVDLGVQAVDWGVAVPIAADGIHQLHRDCDGKTVADFGYTHHTTQWLESVSRATYLLASSPWAGEYRTKIDAYRRRVNEIATILAKPKVRAYWLSKVRDAYGNDFTHRTFMRGGRDGHGLDARRALA